MTEMSTSRTGPRARAAGAPAANAPEPRRWAALHVIALAQLLTALDATIVAIALPTAQRDLGFGDADRQWVVTAYTLAFAGLLLVGGRVGDRIGRRQALVVGLAGFALASGLAGAAPTFELLVAGRALQGAFAALLAPTALSLVVVLFTDPKERGRAFAIYGAVASSGVVVGLVVGGTLTEYVAWRWCLYVNVAFALLALTGALRVIPRLPAYPHTRVPVVSALLGTAGLASLVLGCSRAAASGWTDATVVTSLAAGVLLLTGFLGLQRGAAVPMLPLRLLTSGRRLAAYTAVASAVVGSMGLSLMLTYHFQAVLGWQPVRTGLAFLPLSAAVAVSGYAVSGRLNGLVPARWLIGGGLGTSAAGLALMATLTTHSAYLTTILPSMLLVGLGMGGVFTPAIGVVTGGVKREDAGIASALANTSMQVGGSVGIAVLNTIAITATQTLLENRDVARNAALVHGYATAAASIAVALAVVAVAVMFAVRHEPTPAGHTRS